MRKTVPILLAITLVSAAIGQPGPPPPAAPLKPLFADAQPVRACESLRDVKLPNTTIDSAELHPAAGTRPAVCRVTATSTHPPAGDQVKIYIGLPAAGWNGRFEGTGGGGFSGGSANGVVAPASQGFAAGATDTGHPGASGSFALDSNGHLDWMLIRDNAYLGIHEMTVTGKALVEAFYGKAPGHSYFNGCSTGGRQGLAEAQRYPTDYDGILAGAPAINWTRLHVEQLWGPLVMKESNDAPARCKFQAAQSAAVAACDMDDGVADGVIGDARACKFDAQELVGATPNNCETITQADADVFRKIWEGPRRQDGSFIWYGLSRGGDFTGVSGTAGTPPAPQPNGITLDWWKYFLNQNAQWDWKPLDYGSYEHYVDQSLEEFSAVLATDNPDLSGFRDHNGRIVIWHGGADQLIYPEGTVDYFQKVQSKMGGPEATSKFARFFIAPGVSHCGGGAGAQPAGQFEAVVSWVEEGKAPETLDSVKRGPNGQSTRPICQFPMHAKYKGTGSVDDAANFSCVEN